MTCSSPYASDQNNGRDYEGGYDGPVAGRLSSRLRFDNTSENEREYMLPKISVGPSLTPPGTALSTPLSPLFEGAWLFG